MVGLIISLIELFIKFLLWFLRVTGLWVTALTVIAVVIINEYYPVSDPIAITIYAVSLVGSLWIFVKQVISGIRG